MHRALAGWRSIGSWRRPVGCCSSVYAITSWLLIQIAALVAPAVGLPDWTVRLTLAISMLGLPTAVVLAWIFSVPPASGITNSTNAAGAANDVAHHTDRPRQITNAAVFRARWIALGGASSQQAI